MMVDIKPLKKMKKKYGNHLSKDLLRRLGTSSSFSSDTTEVIEETESELKASPSLK